MRLFFHYRNSRSCLTIRFLSSNEEAKIIHFVHAEHAVFEFGTNTVVIPALFTLNSDG